jgi:hypothetical protein
LGCPERSTAKHRAREVGGEGADGELVVLSSLAMAGVEGLELGVVVVALFCRGQSPANATTSSSASYQGVVRTG